MIGDLTDAATVRAAPRRLRRDLPPRRDGRRQPGGRRPGPHRHRQHRADLHAARGSARGELRRFLYASTVWVYGNAPGPEPHDEDTPLVLPPHLYTATKLAGEMYCRAYERAVRRLDHDPALRHPLRPARPAGRRRAGLHQQGRGRRAAHGRRRRRARPATSSTSRTSPTASSPRSRLQAPAGSTTSSATSTVSVQQIADTVRELVARRPIEHVPDRPVDLEFGRGLGRARAARARLGGRDELSPRASAATSTGSRVTSGSPVASAASSTAGSAATV